LNKTPKIATEYYALAANYEPGDQGLKAYAKDLLLDKLFGAENDLIVPTAGVWEKNGSGQFPIAAREVFSETDGIQHGNFFSKPAVNEQLLAWLRP